MSKEAEAAFGEWLIRNENRWWEDGADPKEVREDVEMHLQMKSGQLGRALDTEDMDRALREMGESALVEVSGIAGAVEKRNLPFHLFGWVRVFKSRFFLGVWPILVVLVEGVFGFLGDIIFDPISRWPQLVLLLGVGVLALAGQYCWKEKRAQGWFVFLVGAGLVPVVYWGVLSVIVIVTVIILFVHGVLMSFGVAMMGIPIAMVCATIAAAPLFAGAGFLRVASGRRRQMPWICGLGAGLLLLILVEAPAYVTRYGLANDDPNFVRNWGSTELLGDIAREGTWGYSTKDTSGLMTDPGLVGDFMKGSRRKKEDVLLRRRFYYRVTGESAFGENSGSFLSSRRNSGGKFDKDQGGDEVGGMVKNLDISDSRLDGHIDGASGLGYWEWTMDFSNRGKGQKEARMQILLPPGGVVSRLTLWVDGEPQEAAFGAKSKVTAAYKSVVKRRRDPVLVRWIGVDRVLVQCFPVPENREMKIRLGVTAPLDMQGRFYLPRIAEKNFSFKKDLQTAVWVQGDVEMSMDNLEGTGEAGRWRETHGSLSLEALTNRHTYVACHGVVEDEVVWAEDQFAIEGEGILIREKLADHGERSRSVVLVVDGSKYFGSWDESFKRAVEILKNRGIAVKVLYAAEEGVHGEAQDLEFVGGQDNIPALMRGLEVAAKEKADELIWLHGAQPVGLENAESFLQLLERGFHRVKISTMDLAGGPNRLLEQLESSISISSAGRPVSPDDLEDELIRVVEDGSKKYRYTKMPKGSDPKGQKVWGQLARWYVWDMINNGLIVGESRDDLARRAAKYQLVTPVSGAVVLERKEQYERFGLEQVDEMTTPSMPGIPEPSTGLLLLLATTMAWRRSRGE